MAKKIKKVDVKTETKVTLMQDIIEYLKSKGMTVFDNAEEFGFTKGTIVVRCENCDVQLKPITPKQGVTRYETETEE